MRRIFSLRPYLDAGRDLGSLLLRHRQLISEMTRREIRGQHAGQLLGSMWALTHPLFLVALYVFLFAYVYTGRVAGNEADASSLATYVLAGLIPWLSFADALNRGTCAIVIETALVKQVVFPIEILPVKSALVAFMGQLVSTPILIAVMIVVDGHLPPTITLLPLLLGLQLIAMIGASYLLSALAVYIRDTRELVRIFTTAGLFLAPILYQPAWVEQASPAFGRLLLFNPFSHLIWCYQDALFFGHIAHPWSWVVLILSSIVTLLLGYRVFKRLRVLFGDVL